jgi:hypothetical protein
MIKLLLLCAMAAAALAQQAQNASITGVVKDSVAGKPLADYTVSTYINATYVGDVFFSSPEAKQVSATTDAQGRYKLSDLPPGDYRITAQPPRSFAGRLTRHLSINGRDLENIDFPVAVAGRVTGRIVDENREPVPGMHVKLVSREYYSGVLGYFIKSIATTDDRGVYTMDRIDPEHPYLLMAETAVGRLSPRSEAPLDPKLRRRVPMRTFFPNSPDREGGSPIVLRPGERREGVDIEVKKSASYCVEGTASGIAGPAELYVQYESAQPAYGTSSTGGMFSAVPGTKTGPDGKYRFCGLTPGPYRLAAFDGYQGAINRSLQPIEIRDRDLVNANLTIGPGIPLEGEVAWDGAAPETPSTVKVSITLNPLLRSPVANERASARADIPGTFSIAGLLPADYAVRAFIGGGLYVKDVQYAGQSVLYAPLRFGSATGNAGLRVIVARDGARVNARVQDKDGNPLGDMRVLVLPAGISSEGMLQSALVTGQTDQRGTYRSQALRPGKYFIVATQDRVNATPESIDNLWRSRTRFQEIELTPNGTAQATLTPVSLR